MISVGPFAYRTVRPRSSAWGGVGRDGATSEPIWSSEAERATAGSDVVSISSSAARPMVRVSNQRMTHSSTNATQP